MNAAPLPLEGVTVLDMSRVLAGPYASMLLADMGADVIKIESPQGDETRHWGPPWFGEGTQQMSAYFSSVNRNKRSVVLNLKTAAGKHALQQLVSQVDVLLENFRPGTLARLGFDAPKLWQCNPRLIYASISGYGSTGPSSHLAGYDVIIEALGGLMSLTGAAEGEPSKVGVAIVDVVTGCHAAMGILAALVRRGMQQTQQGQRVEVSLLESNMSMLVNQAANFLASQQNPARWGNAHPNIVPYQQFQAKDQAVMVAVGNDKQFQALCVILGVPELAEDARFSTNPARVQHRALLVPQLQQCIGTWQALALSQAADAQGVPLAPINTLAQACAHPQLAALGTLTESHHPQLGSIPLVASPITLQGTTPPMRPPPLLGEHTAEIFAAYGIEIEASS